MPINSKTIDEICARYERELDRFKKMTRLVEDICNHYFIEDSRFLVNITSRTKSVFSLRNKLERLILKNEKREWKTAEDVFSNLSDFCGVRIALYSSTDAEAIKAGIRALFEINGDFDHKDKNRQNPALFYKAVHAQVSLKEEVLAESGNENLRQLTCEIQICSMMAHVWNEIEHDLQYKPTGALSSEEKIRLIELGRLTRQGEKAVEDLIACHIARIQNDDRLDVTGLAETIATLFDIERITFRNSISNLFVVLQQLNITKKSELRKALGLPTNTLSAQARKSAWEHAKRELLKFNTYLATNGLSTLQLEARNSADPAVWLLVSRNHEGILKVVVGPGRPTRIRTLATQYASYVAKKTRRAGKSVSSVSRNQGST